jgi:sialate O-acetylesterase
MKRRATAIHIILAALLMGAVRDERPALRLHGLFADGMVLQRERPCPVWGAAAANDEVAVSIAGQTKTARAGADGRWSLKLDPLTAGGPYELSVTGPGTLTVKDVLVGEVWVAAGGSNMEMPLRAAKIAQTASDDDAIAKLRFFGVAKGSAEEPQPDVGGSWISGRAQGVGEVSAAAYYFARELQRALKVPVGILQASADDSRADQWISRRGLGSTRGGRSSLTLHSLQMANYGDTTALYQGSLRRAEEARKKGEPEPRILPKPPKPDPVCDLYNARIAPLMPFAIRGAIWYQGEAELFSTWTTETLFPGLIRSWREEWGQGEFPFGFVQLAGQGPRPDAGGNSLWAQYRDAQRKALAVPHVGMAVAIDLGEEDSVRPRNKEDVGRRLALWAEAEAYGRAAVWSGPAYDSIKIEGEKIRILFKHVGGGLKSGEGRLRGFRMSGDFRSFVDADAVIDGDTVVVSSKEVRWPAAVRYGWADNPDCNLYNKEGLPASPFRSDNW